MRSLARLSLWVALALALPALASAQVAAVLANVTGKVDVLRGSAVTPGTNNLQLTEGSTVKTGNGSAVVLFMNGARVSVLANTELLIKSFSGASASPGTPFSSIKSEPGRSSTTVNVKVGTIVTVFEGKNPASTFEMETPVGIAGIRGTATFLNVRGTRVRFSLRNGSGYFKPLRGAPRNLGGGEGVTADENGITGEEGQTGEERQIVDGADQGDDNAADDTNVPGGEEQDGPSLDDVIFESDLGNDAPNPTEGVGRGAPRE